MRSDNGSVRTGGGLTCGVRGRKGSACSGSLCSINTAVLSENGRSRRKKRADLLRGDAAPPIQILLTPKLHLVLNAVSRSVSCRVSRPRQFVLFKQHCAAFGKRSVEIRALPQRMSISHLYLTLSWVGAAHGTAILADGRRHSLREGVVFTEY